MKNTLFIKNAKSPLPSVTLGAPLAKVTVSIVPDGSQFKAEAKANGESFSGKGTSVVIALNDLTLNITKAAIKPEHKGRISDRVKIAAALLQLGPANG